MTITVLGASGKTGRHIVTQALAAGHTVQALVRRPGALDEQPNLRIVLGDATNPDDVATASRGADCIISALGTMGGKLLTDAVTALLAACEITGVRRVILMSSWLVRREQIGPFIRFATGLALGTVIKDKAASEAMLRQSGLDWTIVHAATLTNKSGTGSVRVLPPTTSLGLRYTISRADAAAWMLAEAEAPAFVGQEVTVANT